MRRRSLRYIFNEDVMFVNTVKPPVPLSSSFFKKKQKKKQISCIFHNLFRTLCVEKGVETHFKRYFEKFFLFFSWVSAALRIGSIGVSLQDIQTSFFFYMDIGTLKISFGALERMFALFVFLSK